VTTGAGAPRAAPAARVPAAPGAAPARPCTADWTAADWTAADWTGTELDAARRFLVSLDPIRGPTPVGAGRPAALPGRTEA